VTDRPHNPMTGPGLRLSGITLPDGRIGDVVMTTTMVTEVVAASPASADRSQGHRAETTTSAPAEVLHLPGYLVTPALVEPHAHLDKALTWSKIGPPVGDLKGAIRSWSEWSATLDAAEVDARVRRSIRLLLANGCTAVRTHVDVAAGPAPLRALEVVLGIKDQLHGVLDLQVVAFVLPGASDGLIRDALALGADLLGGLAHLCDDPIDEHRRLFQAARTAGVGLDLHTDEQLDPEMLSLLDLCSRVNAGEAAGPVTASHCCSLGMLDTDRRTEVAEAVASAGIAVVTLPQTNLYLQGRESPISPPRGLTAVRALLDAGVPLAAGGDNLQDPFNPMGRADPLEAASLLVTAGHLGVAEGFAAVSSGARQVLGLAPAGPAVGDVPDLLAIRASSVVEAMAVAPADRIVIRGGRVVSTTTTTRKTLLDGSDESTASFRPEG